ncbi:MAG: 4'-phosphopantetheinyl transferase superfamily protein [Nannocystaceae bacterium]
MQGPLFTIGDDEVHLWHVDPTAIGEPGRLALYDAWMTADERARQQRFVFERHRHAFLIARALVRGTLSRYVDRDPGAWRFIAGPHGRPALDPGTPAPLRFNLSHTDGCAVLAIAPATVEVGVDVERRRPSRDLLGIARHSFAPPEIEALLALDGDARLRRFFDYWTLKEAYIKARGVGISLGLDNFAFTVADDPTTPPTIDFVPGFDDDPAAWTFRRLLLGDALPIALALQRPAGSELVIRAMDALPEAPAGLAAPLAGDVLPDRS